ncbi:MAG: sulfatase-like hydrolase/transferase [Ferruginibacter sp.]|nr:sulfatase-like hydrolase/transferase [Ferruginibacter sp.]
MKKLFQGRYSLLFSIVFLYLIVSTAIRLALTIWSLTYLSGTLLSLLPAFGIGFLFDLTIGLFFVVIYNLYLLFFPHYFIGSFLDKALTLFILFLTLFIMYFGSLAEFTFWDEFGSRFNFIAVDYLIYTYEVVENINESYPLPLLIGGLICLVLFTIWIFFKRGIMNAAFTHKMGIFSRLKYSAVILLCTILFISILRNKQGEFSKNTVVNELSKNGIFSLFAAYKSNELDYEAFYITLPQNEVWQLLKTGLLQPNQRYVVNEPDNISRETIPHEPSTRRPNIIMVTIESLSADFLSSFGNTEKLTPNYDSLAKESIFFTNLYATGTRTVRGMEALTLCVPPTPGNSIVRRPNNSNLYSINTIFKQRGYHSYFVYGGDGYFDNMNAFFGGQGFYIVDRDRGNPIPENIATERFRIQNNEVSFENAWGICDEDIYKQSLKFADIEAKRNRPFFQFIMTTSNHKPYTFPEGKIKRPQGSRESAVEYTDYALGKFLREAKQKPWFNNTVFVIVADHCSSSAGKWEINLSKHHIPCIIFNSGLPAENINRLTSQIDIMPTLFGYLGWEYVSSFYGLDINQIPSGQERAFVGNYRTLGLLKQNIFTQLDDKKGARQFNWNKSTGDMEEFKHELIDTLINETISYYQSASQRFKQGKMKETASFPN